MTEMTRRQDSSSEELPRMAPWTWAIAASFLPLLLLFFLPRSWMIPMFAASALTFLAGIAMMLLEERRRKARE